jgi:DNA-directed RNA polymerase specialized sigma24 family protein
VKLSKVMNNGESITRMTTDQEALERIVLHAFGLRPMFRRVFLLCDIQGFTVAKAASILGISSTAATARLERARREMNVRLAVASPLNADHLPNPLVNISN